ncbi:metallopeptidase TldD-related protein [Marinitoga aeolica]|uniref:Metalloprotease TldD/E C-terminal domain-containing protein n=1 Tax=Marinitoga aeolica TaxID=2809031 RepID=A0ABY8PQH8_9BACT|nr:metallopeptidase TldD-related protein [Marinitoga aeolica]WGS64877.1 hypothetical protein JRV97_11055 [Marinitoga aeolica]
MIKEKYQIHNRELSLNIVQTEIESIRKKDIVKTGIRIYDNGKIGVAGSLGNYNEKELETKAKENLKLNIPYEYDITQNISREEVEIVEISENEFVEKIEKLMREIKEKHNDFSFSNKITLKNSIKILENDLNTKLYSELKYFSFELIFKHKSSANIFDGFVGYEGFDYSHEKFINIVDEVCGAFNNVVDIEENEYPIIFLSDDFTILKKFYTDLNGLSFGSESSIFSNKIGEKIFSNDFTLYQSRNHEDGIIEHFFDAEGTINEENRFPLIENGVLKSPYTDKKTANMFNLPLTGAAEADYDSVPSLGFVPMSIKKSDKTLKELLNGKKGILVFIASGGDFTPDGKFGTPVQLGFLYDGEKLIGRVPEFKINSDIYSMFGKDFIGVGKDSITQLGKNFGVVINMKIMK